MIQTIRLSSCVSVQGEFVAVLENGDVIIRDGDTTYRGSPVARRSPSSELPNAVVRALDPSIRRP
jgi:hypothetical protein